MTVVFKWSFLLKKISNGKGRPKIYSEDFFRGLSILDQFLALGGFLVPFLCFCDCFGAQWRHQRCVASKSNRRLSKKSAFWQFLSSYVIGQFDRMLQLKMIPFLIWKVCSILATSGYRCYFPINSSVWALQLFLSLLHYKNKCRLSQLISITLCE